MDNLKTIELNPSVKAPASAVPRGAKKTPKPKAVEPDAAASEQSNRTGKPASKRTAAKPIAANGVGGGKAKKIATKHADTKPGTRNSSKSKKGQLIGLLSKRGGARISVLVERLGWQTHTVRAALSGLRKQGFVISVSKSAKSDETVYAITSASDATGIEEVSA
ncbi:MAG: DUF3489 domain-containing protein [Nitratireductor sp.]|nr:DUF3489 domain-containing protein [Nitratireductor sp.]